MGTSSKHSGSNEAGEWVFGGKLRRMPAPRTANWLELYGSWSGFVAAVHQSIGGDRGSGDAKRAET
jgi:hypothetical protein